MVYITYLWLLLIINIIIDYYRLLLMIIDYYLLLLIVIDYD